MDNRIQSDRSRNACKTLEPHKLSDALATKIKC
jgi:hypothetical protein